jgi:hypothetical protein
MEKPYYKVILLFFASDTEPIFRNLKILQEKYIHLNNNIKCFFTYSNNPELTPKEYDLVYKEYKENHHPPNATGKVVRAMEHIVNNYKFDFLIRTNLSTFWDFDRLLKRLDTLPKEKCLAGRFSNSRPHHVAGTGMILSPDMVNYIIENQQLVVKQFPRWHAEDRLISNLIIEGLNFKPIDLTKNNYAIEDIIDYNEEIVKERLMKAYQSEIIDNYRIKNHRTDRLKVDLPVVKLILKMLYNIDD